MKLETWFVWERVIALFVVGGLALFLVPAMKDQTPWIVPTPTLEVGEVDEPERAPRCECGRDG